MQPDNEDAARERLRAAVEQTTGLSPAETALLARLDQLARRTVETLAERAALPPDQQKWVLSRAAVGLRERGLVEQAARLEEEARALDAPDPDPAPPEGGTTPPPDVSPPPVVPERRRGLPDRRRGDSPWGALIAPLTPVHLLALHLAHAGLLAVLVRVVLVAGS